MSQEINFTARTVLRMGVALLGARISVELLIGLGVELIGLVVLGVVATIAFAWLGPGSWVVAGGRITHGRFGGNLRRLCRDGNCSGTSQE